MSNNHKKSFDFCENARKYHIISASSLLGVAIHAGTSFPVGKVDFLDLTPLNFFEFLEALNEKALLQLWNNIPTQLAKENKKFIYGLVREGTRARVYEIALSWLME